MPLLALSFYNNWCILFDITVGYGIISRLAVSGTYASYDNADLASNLVLVDCGDLNVTEQCTVTFEVKIN